MVGRGTARASSSLHQRGWRRRLQISNAAPRQMRAKDNSLDDIEGRLHDLDQMGVDFQVVYPTALVWVFDLENKELAGAVCRAYNDYVAEQCARAPKRLNGVALVPIQDPSLATEEAL